MPKKDEEIAARDSAKVVLALADLLPDPGGEIVIRSTGDGMIGVIAGEAITATGTAEAHVTAAGENVAGLLYYQFGSGVTLYCGPDVTVGSDIS
jgi:hypothetical protein